MLLQGGGTYNTSQDEGGHLFWLVDSVRDGPDVVAQFNAHHLDNGGQWRVKAVLAGLGQ